MRICLLGDARSIHIRRMARGLADRGCCVRVVSHKIGDVPGATVERFRIPDFSWRYPRRWHRRRSMYLRRIMRQHDVVHVNFLVDWGLTPEIARNGCLVASPWGSDIVKPPDLDAYPDGVMAMRRSLLRMADRVVVYGNNFASVVARFADLPLEDMACVPMGVDLDFFRSRPHERNGSPTIGFFKGFKAVYGPTIWVRAIPKVLARCPNARFEFVGRGPLLAECRSLACSLGVSNAISWLDYQPDEKMPEVLGRWDLSVMPSFCESFGVAALESSAVGVPVVASRVGGLNETIRDGVTGLLVPPGDSDALAEAVIRLLDDVPLRRRMGLAGRALVASEFNGPDCLDRLLNVYENARSAHVTRSEERTVAGRDRPPRDDKEPITFIQRRVPGIRLAAFVERAGRTR